MLANCSHPSCLCSPNSKIGSSSLKGCGGNCGPGGKQWQPTGRFMTHVTCRLTAKNRDQLRNPTLGNWVWATFTFSCQTNRHSCACLCHVWCLVYSLSMLATYKLCRGRNAVNIWPICLLCLHESTRFVTQLFTLGSKSVMYCKCSIVCCKYVNVEHYN